MIPYLKFDIRSVIFKQILGALIEATQEHSVVLRLRVEGPSGCLSLLHVSLVVSIGATSSSTALTQHLIKSIFFFTNPW